MRLCNAKNKARKRAERYLREDAKRKNEKELKAKREVGQNKKVKDHE